MSIVTKALNLGDLFHLRVSESSAKTAILSKEEGVWTGRTWSDVERYVYRIARALEKSGVKQGDRVAILAATSPEWTCIDFALMSLGAVCVPIYPTVMASDVQFILAKAEVKWIFVDDAVQAAKLGAVGDSSLEKDQRIVLHGKGDLTTVAFQEWLDLNAPTAHEVTRSDIETWRLKSKSFDSTALATLIFTSGTTGEPKGVRLNHSHFLSMCDSIVRRLPIASSDTFLAFLPLSHVLGRAEQWLFVSVGWMHAYAESLAKVVDNIFEIKPTCLVAVPRIYEKFYSKILSQLDKSTGFKKTVMEQALKVGRAYSRALQSGRTPSIALRAQHAIYDKVLYSKVRERFGGRIRFCITGGAALSAEIIEFFHACGILILEGYGLTETTGPVCVNSPQAYEFGTVGKSLAGVDVKIASDGEIWLRGPQILQSYLSSDTSKSLEDGWFATGDIGEITPRGSLRITDRKKDIIVTSGGKNVAPQKIENLIKADPLFSQVLVIGNERKYLSALITVDPVEARKASSDSQTESIENVTVIRSKTFLTMVDRKIREVNSQLPSFEQIKRFQVLAREFSVEAGEISPSLKIKRKFCEKKYERLIESMYGGAAD
ncbi:MAG TPA: long-chain fatty acid--CoA ligase [Bdellovibrionota bacterium]|nr:long-chain fatty acid--CoA ligase [Bdellovibrionota bacterium]